MPPTCARPGAQARRRRPAAPDLAAAPGKRGDAAIAVANVQKQRRIVGRFPCSKARPSRHGQVCRRRPVPRAFKRDKSPQSLIRMIPRNSPPARSRKPRSWCPTGSRPIRRIWSSATGSGQRSPCPGRSTNPGRPAGIARCSRWRRTMLLNNLAMGAGQAQRQRAPSACRTGRAPWPATARFGARPLGTTLLMDSGSTAKNDRDPEGPR